MVPITSNFHWLEFPVGYIPGATPLGTIIISVATQTLLAFVCSQYYVHDNHITRKIKTNNHPKNATRALLDSELGDIITFIYLKTI